MLPNGNNTTHQPMVDNNVMKASTISPSSTVCHQPIMMRNDDGTVTEERLRSGSVASTEEKKLQKRAANRRSAQLSRKRKKQFIEELKEENDDLRRKEQILRSIPDLIVVFDSSGKLGFVSHSVSNFLEFTPDELMGRSFWDRLCEESVRLLKAAFMDALAARNSESDTIPLGSGVWELRIQDKNGKFVLVTLNGVVHFSGDAPECVCSIRPMQSGGKRSSKDIKDSSNQMFSKPVEKTQMSDLIYGTIKPEQSVVKKDALPYQRNVRQKVATGPDGRPVAISDIDSGTSVVSSE
jgi:PAS domain S-box-containing protein